MSTTSDLDLLKVNSLEQTTAINLLKIKLVSGEFIFLCDSFDFNYLDEDFIYLDFSISGDLETQGGEKTRPSIELANPNGMFSKLAIGGLLEGALITRYQIEAEYGAQNVETAMIKTDVWKVYQIPIISTKLALQVRRLGDNLGSRFPPRGYYPPEFNHVNT